MCSATPSPTCSAGTRKTTCAVTPGRSWRAGAVRSAGRPWTARSGSCSCSYRESGGVGYLELSFPGGAMPPADAPFCARHSRHWRRPGRPDPADYAEGRRAERGGGAGSGRRAFRGGGQGPVRRVQHALPRTDRRPEGSAPQDRPAAARRRPWRHDCQSRLAILAPRRRSGRRDSGALACPPARACRMGRHRLWPAPA